MQIVSRGKLLGIATRAAERAPMQEVSSAEITLEAGVGRDSRGRARAEADHGPDA